MKALKFTLSGRTAFFKDNSINSIYLTYGNIHRIALLGILGAIMGYSGYNQQGRILKSEKKKVLKDFPEFYEKLKDLKISIVSNGRYGTFSKKIQSFNNGVGYASEEKGGNLIVKQFWLEQPSWDIYIINDSEVAQELINKIINKKSIYIPCLGSNDHFADITSIEEIELTKVVTKEELVISSMIDCNIDEKVAIEELSFVDDPFKYMEYLPMSLSLELNQHIKNKIMITNMYVLNLNSEVYSDSGKNIIFY